MPVNYDINIIKGSTFTARVAAKNADGSSVNLSGYATRGYVKNKYSDSGILLDLKPVPTAGYETSGFIDIIVPASGTALLPVTQGVYDIEMYGPTGNDNPWVIKLLDGRVNIHPEVTSAGSVPMLWGYGTPVEGEASSQGSGPASPAPTTTTTTTTSMPGGGGNTGGGGGNTGGGGGMPASIQITAPNNNATVTLPFDLTVLLENADHWHFIDEVISPQGFGNYNVGQDITNVGVMVTAGLNTHEVTASDLTGGTSWGPGRLHVVAVDSDHKILANEHGNRAEDQVLIGLM
jgi:hypothetical protein